MRSKQQTTQLAAEWSSALVAGDLVLLSGPLGAGKTFFVQSVALALGVTEPITSPTYNLIHEHSGTNPLVHMDLYRLTSSDEFALIGGWEYLDRGGICFVEWPECLRGPWPRPHWLVTFTLLKTVRHISLERIENE